MISNPFRSGEFYHLSRANIQASSYKFGVTSLESDRWITCRDEAADGSGQLTVVDVPNNFSVTKKPNKAEAAIMHLTQNIVALKAKDKDSPGEKYILQVYDLDKKARLKNVEVNEKIEFWKWLNNNKLGIVTASSAYHIDIRNETEGLVKLFDRVGPLSSGCQIIGLALDPQEKWALLTAISSPDGGKTINGHIQLNLLGAEVKNQLLEGHCGCFGEAYIHNPQHKSTLFSYFERKAGESTSKIYFSEIGPPAEGKSKFKANGEISFASEKPNDFPIYMQISSKFGVLYVITKFGYYLIYEISTASVIGKGKLSDDPIFIGARHAVSDGVLAINKKGSVIGLSCDPNALVPHIMNQCKHIPNNVQVAIRLAANCKLPGTEKLLEEEFNKAFVQGDYQGAARIVSDCMGLRTQETIQKFKNAPAQPGQPQPIVQYFQVLLEKVKLNSFEAVELVGPVLKQGRLNFVEDWINNNKLECSDALGDLIRPFSNDLALKVYKQCANSTQLFGALAGAGQLDEAMKLAESSGMKADYLGLIRSTCSTNPEAALNLAKQVAKKGQVNVHAVAEIFLQFNRIQELTAFLVESMRDNRPEDANFQTKVLELNLMAAPHVAETIFQMGIWSQFNKQKIALLCEQKGLAQRALENYTDIKDIRRCILNTNPANINQEWLANYLTKIQSDWTLQILQDLLRQSRQNLSLCVQIAIANHQKLGTENVIKVFDAVSAYEGNYYFLGSILKDTEDPELHYKYIEAAVKCNQLKDVERIIRESKNYDPVRVKDFLKEIKLADPKPLIYLCDIHGFVDELTKYLFKNNYNKFIEIYIFKVNPAASPSVLGTLIDLEADENYIKQILYNLRGNCPIDELVAEFEKRNKLRVLENWLESRVSEGNQTPSIHNALAMIYIDTNKDPQTFLANNPYYDSKIIGQYCEERDPHLALTAYKRAWGSCDNELVELTNKNGLYRLQAKYLVERQSKELWASVLSPDNPHRKWIIEQVVSSALPDSKNVEEVSTTVQAFMAAELPLELIGLLEKIVLHNSTFSSYKKLQNLLIITAMKADKTKVMDFINRLDNYDGPEIAKVALGEEYQLYEEAFTIYNRNKMYVEAIEVLLNNIESIPRAAEFAEKNNQPEVWTKLAKAYLDNNQVVESIEAYLKANDPSMYLPVIQAAEREEKYEHLIKYLLMARQTIKDAKIDTELCYCYAKAGKNSDLEVFIAGNNSADIAKVGDRCYDEKLFEAAKILFVNIKNNTKIASCLIQLKQFQQAIDAANKANNPKTWKELCKAAVAAGDFKIANSAGLNVIVHSDLLDEIILHYEKYGCPEEAITLLETGKGIKGKGAIKSIITELGVLYAKYMPEKVMELIKNYSEDIIETKLMRVCERFLLWSEVAYLYSRYNEYDNAINVMIEHSPFAWNHEQFVSLIQKIRNIDLHYKAVLFYLDEQPLLLNDLLKSIATTIDLTRLVTTMKKTAYLSLIAPFLKSVQSSNNQAVNEALNQIHLQNEDYEELRRSVTQYENFDMLSLAKETEGHEIMEFRRIAAYLYRKIGKYAESIVLSKQDEMYRDCVETALESGNYELIEDLLKFFIKKKDNEFFLVTLYTCYEHIRPDAVLELAWRFNLMEYAMPYFVQISRELTHRVEHVQKKHEEREKKEEKAAQQQMNQPLDIVGDMIMPGLNTGMPMLTMDGYGGQPGGFGGQPGGFGGQPGGFGGQPGGFGGQPGGFGGYGGQPGF